MSLESKGQYLDRIYDRYQRAGLEHKGKILDEFCAVCSYHRKSALRLLNPLDRVPRCKPGPKPVYDPGHDRLEHPELAGLMNDIYEHEWRLLHNFFLPKAKLSSKEKLGSNYRKKYDKPKTPQQRLLESKSVSDKVKLTLQALFAGLNPLHLREEPERKLRLYSNRKSNLNREATMS